jgi:uncharacterized protein
VRALIALSRFLTLAALAVAMLLAALSPAFGAQVPYLTGRVVDNAEILGPEARKAIQARLEEHERRTTDQIVVLTLPSLEGESIEDYADETFNAWKLGRKGKDNGVLLLVVPPERRMRIEVGYGLEGSLTDAAASRIIRNVLAPQFRSGDFDAGITQGVEAIIGVLGGGEAPADAAIADAAPAEGGGNGSASDNFFEGPDLPLTERILIGAFVFGIIGLFTIIGVLTPGMGWFLYLFLIPFWAMFPIIVVGTKGALILLGTYVIGYPIAKIVVSRLPWYKKARSDLKTKGSARVGGFVVSGGGSSWSSGGSSSGGSSGGFSGGGGSSGGGGASGSW